MFCPNCGNSVHGDLKYCNGCGKRLIADLESDSAPAKMLNKILITLFLIVFFGLALLVGLVGALLGSGVAAKDVIILSVVYLATIFGISVTLLRQVPKLIDARLKTNDRPSDYAAAPQLQPRTTAQLEDYREPVMSVTDHTTRILDKVPVKDD